MDALRRHTELLADYFESEQHACRDIRKHVSWYFKGYGIGSELRRSLATVESLDEMDALFERMDRSMPYPGEGAEGPRGRAGHPRKPHLPDGWLDSRSSDGIDWLSLADAETADSGG